jgi:hypothetical protein
MPGRTSFVGLGTNDQGNHAFKSVVKCLVPVSGLVSRLVGNWIFDAIGVEPQTNFGWGTRTVPQPPLVLEYAGYLR